ncbi:hypothetical protein SDC9_67925 [bioreactor metagenome]|uniref:C2H2-type domain-containing protein n=1 Tax=bioreactor metagenome TaxID=1076179 RepID=A0A644Y0Q0_9ZZZZ
MAMWGIFKCQLCGKKFKEKFTPEQERNIQIDHIGKYTHIISTHVCKDGKYGCGVLIGAENRTRSSKKGEEN